MSAPRKNALEWLTFAGSLVLIIALVTILVREGAQEGDSPPELEVTAGAVSQSGEAFQLHVTVLNRGSQTAENATIEVLLMREDAVIEQGELQLAFVPRRSKREGWVVFREDPRRCRIVTRAVGFNQP